MKNRPIARCLAAARFILTEALLALQVLSERRRLVATALALTALAGATAATGKDLTPADKGNGLAAEEEVYLKTWLDCWEEFKSQCGRNLVDDGLSSGKPPSEQRVKESTQTMKNWLNPPEPTVAVSSAYYAPSATSTAAPSSDLEAIAQCESGGDYGAVNSSSGAYGRYQIMPSTSAAYGCDMSSPAGQDACAQEIYAAEGSAAWVC